MQSRELTLEEKIKKLPDSPKQLREKIDLLNDLAGEIGLIKTRRALAFAKEAYRLSKRTDYARGRAYSARNIAVCYLILSRLNRALQFANEAQQLFISLEDHQGQAAVLNTRAMILLRLGSFQRALEVVFKALEINREIGFRQGEGETLYTIAVIYAEIDEYDPAIDYFQQARKTFCAINDPGGEARALIGLGKVHQAMGDLKKSLQIHLKALNIIHEHDLPGGLNHTLLLGKLFQESGQLTEARKYLEQALTTSQNLENTEMLAVAHLELGRLALDENELELSLKQLTTALHYAEQRPVLPTIARVHQALADLYERLEQPELALFHFKRFHQLHLKTHEQESLAKIHTLQIRLEMEQAESKTKIHRQDPGESAE